MRATAQVDIDADVCLAERPRTVPISAGSSRGELSPRELIDPAVPFVTLHSVSPKSFVGQPMGTC